ncbi:MAG: hypothetical protein K2X03_18915 [Bryobacteraceae bacterium]|nr:hypothetical protein [Bryobacteraceae bacterium]
MQTRLQFLLTLGAGASAQTASADRALQEAMLRGESISTALTLSAGYLVMSEAKCVPGQRRLERQAALDPEAKALLSALSAQNLREDAPEYAALQYVRLAAAAAQGPGRDVFARARQHFNDTQIIELSLLAAYYAFAARMSLAQGLTDSGETSPFVREPALPNARIALNPFSEAPTNLPAFLRVLHRLPDHAAPIMRLRATLTGLPSSTRRLRDVAFHQAAQVNFTRYTLADSVLLLRQSGFTAAQIVALGEGDQPLNPKEKAAAVFARQLTVDPAASAAGYQTLRSTLGAEAAYHVLLAAAWSNFVQRIGDGLRLPIEPAARQAYREVFRLEPSNISER